MAGVEMNNVCSIGPNDQLLKAVQSNDISLFKNLLKTGLENSLLNLDHLFNEPYHGTILDICCMSAGRSEFVKVLLSFSIVDVNIINKSRKKAPIHLVAVSGCKDTLGLLLEHPQTDINLLDGDGNSALHLVAKSGYVKCTELLLEANNIKANQLNKKLVTPAYLAATAKKKNDNMMLAFIRYLRILN